MFLGNKKCRIYAACGVSQTPNFEKNRKERGARHGERFKTIEDFIERVLDCKLQKTRNMESAETEKIELLCELFDYSRKGEEE